MEPMWSKERVELLKKPTSLLYLTDRPRLSDEEAKEELGAGGPNILGRQPLVVAQVALEKEKNISLSF